MNTRKFIGGATAVAFAVASALVLAPGAYAEEVPVEETIEVVEQVVEAPAEPAPAPVDPPPAPEAPAPAPEPVIEPLAAPAPAPEPAPVVEPVVETQKVELSVAPAEADATKDKTNNVKYWEGLYPGTDCYKDSHGTVTNGGKAVTLPEFNPDWPGDRWEVLIVKGGSVDLGDGPGNVVYELPTAGTPYFAPLNAGGNVANVSHWIVCKGTTPPVVVEPRACVGVGDWYTEGDDLPPVVTPEGLLFQGGSGKAVGIRVPVDGNLQGWTSLSFENTGGQSDFFFRIVIDTSMHEGGKSYQSLSFPGYSVVNQDSVSYQFGESIAATALRFPNAVIKSVGFQTNSGASAEFSAVLKNVTGPCATINFVPETYTPTCTTVNDEQWIEGDGVITVPGGWVSNSIAVPFSGNLADIGTVLNIDATPLQYVGLHIDTAQGTIVFEEEPSYGGKVWSSSAWTGVSAGMGYPAFGTIEEFITWNGDVPVTGIRLLYTHPDASSTTVTSFTIGCTVYTFVPVLPPTTVVPGEWVAGDYDCDDTSYEETRTVVTTTYTRGENGQPVPHVETTTESRTIEREADCPVVVTPPPAPAGNTTTTPPLAATGGGDISPLIPFGALGALMMGALAVLLGRRARLARQD